MKRTLVARPSQKIKVTFTFSYTQSQVSHPHPLLQFHSFHPQRLLGGETRRESERIRIGYCYWNSPPPTVGDAWIGMILRADSGVISSIIHVRRSPLSSSLWKGYLWWGYCDTSPYTRKARCVYDNLPLCACYCVLYQCMRENLGHHLWFMPFLCEASMHYYIQYTYGKGQCERVW